MLVLLNVLTGATEESECNFTARRHPISPSGKKAAAACPVKRSDLFSNDCSVSSAAKSSPIEDFSDFSETARNFNTFIHLFTVVIYVDTTNRI